MTRSALLVRYVFALVLSVVCCSTGFAQTSRQDTIVKIICAGMTPPDKSYFNFDGGGHIFIVHYSFDNNSGLSITPSTPQMTTIGPPITFDVFAQKEGEYTVAVSWTCQDPGCHETDSAYVRFVVRPCGPCMFRDYYSGFDGKKVITVPYREFDPRIDESKMTFKKLAYSANSAYEFVRTDPFSDQAEMVRFYVAPKGRTIVSITPKKERDDGTILILLDDGSTYITYYMPWNYLVGEGWLPPIPLAEAVALAGESFIGFLGDDLYVVRERSVDVSRDSGKSWQIDTAGLNGPYIYDAAINDDQVVFLATTTGVYKQAVTENVWTKIQQSFGGVVGSVFAHGDIVMLGAGTSTGPFVSTDKGQTWQNDTAGIGKKAVKSFAVCNGFMYAIAQTSITSNALYRRSLTGGTWLNIQSGLDPYLYDPRATNVLHGVGGDTIVSVATTYGLFSSTDNGVTWFANNGRIAPENMYGLVRDNANNFIISSNRGLERGKFDGAPWTKLFPSGSGYNNGNAVYRDDAGNLYTLGRAREGYNFRNDPMVSTDNGQSWHEDTVGVGAMNYGVYYVDRTGRQYIASSGTPMHVYTKTSTTAWTLDEAGITGPADTAQNALMMYSDDTHVYLPTGINGLGGLWKRELSGGTWVRDTAGLQSRTLFAMTHGKNGALYAGTFGGGMMRYVNNAWQTVLPPSGVNATASVFALSVDASGTLVAAFGNFNGSYLYTLDDVFYSKDNGASWTATHIPVTNCTYMRSYGDTTYMLTTSGVFSFWSNQPLTGVASDTITLSPSHISVFPNPASGSITVALNHVASTLDQVDILDAKGSIVLGGLRITDAQSNASANEVNATFSIESLPNGTYFVRATTSAGVFTEKFVVMR